MATSERLSEVFQEARKHPITFDDTSRIVFFSDTHRGDNSWADNFAANQVLFFHALNYYFEQGFTYIEVGDGDELWQNPNFNNIRRAHDHIFWRMSEFYRLGRLYLLFGNHDIERSSPKVVQEQLHRYKDDRTQEWKPLFDGIHVHEGLVLRHSVTGREIFVVHGHQGSRINDRFWRFGRLAVRYVWARLQAFGIKDPTRPSQDMEKKQEVESKIMSWIRANNDQVVICGHTHRTAFPEPGDTPYFNTGCCVHPRFITGIELDRGTISLVKWWIAPEEEKPEARSVMFVSRSEICAPTDLNSFYPQDMRELAGQPL